MSVSANEATPLAGATKEIEHASLQEMTQAIIRQLPSASRFGEEDARLISQHQSVLLSLESELVRGFYDTILAHPQMREVFGEEANPAREELLRQWWRRTIDGPFDGHYWAWQALVGLVHVKRGVKNSMMIGMWGWIINWLHKRLAVAVSASENQKLLMSFNRLATTVQALTAESYQQNYIRALQRATGFKPALLDRLALSEIDQMLAEARLDWAGDA